jgi:hypothetical protein
MQLLLVSEKQVPSSKAPCAFRALKGFLLCVRALMSFQMLQSGKGALTSLTNVRAGLIGLRSREIGGRLGCGSSVDSDRSCCEKCKSKRKHT